MEICHPFWEAHRWNGFFVQFLETFWPVFLCIAIFSGLAAWLDRGKLSWYLGLAFCFSALLVIFLDYALAMVRVFTATDQLGQYCHSDAPDARVSALVKPATNTTMFYLQLLQSFLLSAVAFWTPLLVCRKLRNARNQ